MEYEHVIPYGNLEPSPTHKTTDYSAFVKNSLMLDVSDVTANQSMISFVHAACFIKTISLISKNDLSVK